MSYVRIRFESLRELILTNEALRKEVWELKSAQQLPTHPSLDEARRIVLAAQREQAKAIEDGDEAFTFTPKATYRRAETKPEPQEF